MNQENEIQPEKNESEVVEIPETSEQLRAEIEATRDEMSQTIDAIQEKLDPQHIKEKIQEKAHDATIGRIQDLAHAASEQVEDAAKKMSTVITPVAQTAQEKARPLVGKIRRNPVVVAGATVAALALCWVVSKRSSH